MRDHVEIIQDDLRLAIGNYIERGKNLSFIKAGDGEMLCMNGEIGQNCDGHPYSERLGAELKQAYKYLVSQENVIIAQFPYIKPFLPGEPNHEWFESLLFMEGNDTLEFVTMWRTIRNSKRKKHFIGNKTVAMAIFDKLNIDSIIEVPEKNAYASGIPLDQIMKLIKQDDIVLISAGFLGKVMAHIIHKAFEGRITILDTGSAFDPLIKQTRSGQMRKEKAEEIFNKITL